MTAIGRFIADLRAMPSGLHRLAELDPDTLRLLLDVVERAPKPETCDRWDDDKDEVCGATPAHTEDIPDYGRTWHCDKHWQSHDTEDPLGMAILALEAHLAKRGGST